MNKILKNISSCSFLLKERNRKFKTANTWLRISFELLWKLNLSRLMNQYIEYRDFEQKFPFNAFLIHSFNAKYLRSGKHKRS